ncbi:MAG: flagellar export chaperone FliS [Synergistaceae bacterium]|nr:flagellar export chaperone FliS [Synergistaceae bacterium]
MENRNNAQMTYQATQISTATKEQLLLITYDIGIKACRTAEAALSGDEASRDFGLANREIIRAQEVVRELMVTLNTEKGGDMAKSLVQLYDYMYQLLVEANIKKETENIVTVRGMLEELKETWEGALVQLLKEYQAAHPEDADLKNALTDIGEKPAAASAQPQVQTQSLKQPLKQPVAAASAYGNMPKAQPKIITQQPQPQKQPQKAGFTLAF